MIDINNNTSDNLMQSDVVSMIPLRDYFATQAMDVVMQETQEMRIASFWDWIKMLLVTYLHFNFLTVKFVKVKNVYEEASKRAYEYADAMMIARNTK